MSDQLRREFLTGYSLEGYLIPRRGEYALQKAMSAYHSAHRSALWNEVWSRLTKQTNRLLALPECIETIHRHDLGYQTIEISKIQGSVRLNNDFDSACRPLKSHTRDRWIHMAMQIWQGGALPPVELVQIGTVYYLCDGHSRISAMRALKFKYVDAHITRLGTCSKLLRTSRRDIKPSSEPIVANI